MANSLQGQIATGSRRESWAGSLGTKQVGRVQSSSNGFPFSHTLLLPPPPCRTPACLEFDNSAVVVFGHFVVVAVGGEDGGKAAGPVPFSHTPLPLLLPRRTLAGCMKMGSAWPPLPPRPTLPNGQNTSATTKQPQL